MAVSGLDISRRFYIEKLGFVVRFRVDGWSFLTRELRLGHCYDAVPIADCGDYSWFAYLHVADATELYAEYTSAGVISGMSFPTSLGASGSSASSRQAGTRSSLAKSWSIPFSKLANKSCVLFSFHWSMVVT